MMLLFNLIRGLNSIFRYFKLIIIHLEFPPPPQKRENKTSIEEKLCSPLPATGFPRFTRITRFIFPAWIDVFLLVYWWLRLFVWMATCEHVTDCEWGPCLTISAKMVIFALSFLAALCDNYFSQQCRQRRCVCFSCHFLSMVLANKF